MKWKPQYLTHVRNHKQLKTTEIQAKHGAATYYDKTMEGKAPNLGCAKQKRNRLIKIAKTA